MDLHGGPTHSHAGVLGDRNHAKPRAPGPGGFARAGQGHKQRTVVDFGSVHFPQLDCRGILGRLAKFSWFQPLH